MRHVLCCLVLLLSFCLQGQNQVYFSEDFEHGLGSFSNDPGNDTDWTLTSSYFNNGSQSVSNRYDQSQLNVLTQTVSLDLSGASNPIFEFYHIAKTTNFSDQGSVQISVDGGANFVNIPLSAYRGNAANYDTRGYFDEESYAIWENEPAVPDNDSWWKREVFDLTDYTVSNVIIRFRLTSTTAIPRTGWFIDDIKIYEPDCVSPDSQTVSNITDVSAVLSWNERGTATLWDMEYGVEGFRQGNGIPVVQGVSNPYQLNNLSPQTSYDYYVRSVCSSSESSEWEGPFSFETECTAITSFDEDFDSVNIPELPSCWRKLVGASTSIPPTIRSLEFNSQSSPYAIELYNGNNSTDPIILVSPAISNLSGGNNLLTLQARNSSSSQELIVGTLSDPNDASTFTAFTTIDINSNYDRYVVDFSTYTGTDGYVGFSRTNTQNFTRVYLDDLRLEPAPTCATPSDLTATNITGSGAEINWVQAGTVANWDIEYGPTGFARGSGVTIQDVGSNPYALGNLNSLTEYDLYIQADCGMGDESRWSDALTFMTECGSSSLPYVEEFASDPDCWTKAKGQLSSNTVFTNTNSDWSLNNFGNTGSNNSAYLNIYSDGFFEWYISPSFVVNGNQQLSFDIALTEYASTFPADTSGSDDLFAIIISTDDGATWSNTNILRQWDNSGFTNTFNNISSTGESVTIDLSAYSGTIKIGLYGETTVSNADNDLFIDNFNVSDIPTCPAPSMVMVSSTTTNTATVNWTENGTSTLWEVEYGVSGFTLGSGTVLDNLSATSAQLMNLSPSTSYDVYVRSNCGSGDLSIWTGSVSFTTDCVAIMDLSENFENISVPELPICWSSIVQTPPAFSPAVIETSFNSSDSNNEIRMSLGSSTSGDIILVLPEMSNLAAATHELIFDARSPFDASQDIVVGTLSDPTDASTFSPIATMDLGTTYQSFNQDFSSYSGSDRYIGLKRIATTDFTTVNVDNVAWRVLPTCKAPTSLSVTNISDTSADLSWTSGGSGEGDWTVEYGVSGFTEGTGTIVNVTNANYSISNLEFGATYDVYVTAVCSMADQSESSKTSFTTLCGQRTNLDEDFETVADGSVPDCWTALKPGTSTFADLSVRNRNNSKVFNMDNSSSSNGTMILVTPFLTTLSSGNFSLMLEAQATNGSQDLIVGTMSDPNDVSSFTAFSTLDLSSNYQNFTVDFSSYSGTDKYIAFSRVMTQAFTQVNIDNIIWEAIPTCEKPNQVTVLPEFTSAQVSWISGGSGETTWELEYGPTGFTLGTGTLQVANSIISVINNLTESTVYDVYVRATCGASDVSKSSGPVTFTTRTDYCNPGIVSNTTSNNGSNIFTVCPNNPGEKVILDFTKLNLESSGGNGCDEYIRIYDGNSTASTAIRAPSGNNQFCFDSDGGTFDLKNQVIAATTASGCITIELVVFGSLDPEEGFIANVSCIANPYLWDGNNWTNAPEGNITSSDKLYVLKGNSPAVLTQGIDVNNLFIEPGAILKSDVGPVVVSGDSNNYGHLSGSQAYIFRSSSALTLEGNGTIDHMEVDNANNVILQEGHNLNKSLTLTSGNLITNDRLTFKSSENGTAVLNEVSGMNSIVGDVIVERFIPAGNRSFRFLGSTTNGQSVFDGWQESGVNSNGFGTHVTGEVGTVGSIDPTSGLDFTVSGNPSLYEWNQSSSNWDAVLDTRSEILSTGNFYRILIRGDRTTNLSFNSSAPSDVTLRTTGSLTVGSKSIDGSSTMGFTTLANPYQSKIDMSATSRSNIGPDMYYWDPTLNTRGAYTTIDIASGTGTNGSATNIMESGQGVFLLQTGTGLANVTFEETDKVSGSNNMGILSTSSPAQTLKLKLYKTSDLMSGGNSIDGLIMKFNSTENIEYDFNDAIKFANLDENMGIMHPSGNLLAIERRPVPHTNETINLDIERYRSASYSFTGQVDPMPGLKVYIRDNLDGSMTEIIQDGGTTTVDFSIDVNDPASLDRSRFQLVFETITLSIGNEIGDRITLFPNPVKDGELNIQLGNMISENVSLSIFNSVGQEITAFTVDNLDNNTVKVKGLGRLAKGIYFVRLDNEGKEFNAKFIID